LIRIAVTKADRRCSSLRGALHSNPARHRLSCSIPLPPRRLSLDVNQGCKNQDF